MSIRCMSPKPNCSSSSFPPHGRGTSTNAEVLLEIYDSSGQLVFTLLGGVGQTVERRQHPLDAGPVPGAHSRS